MVFIFIDLKKVYGRVTGEILMKEGLLMVYVNVIGDMMKGRLQE